MEGDSLDRRGAARARRLLARRQLPVGRADLPARQPAAARAARPEHVKPRLLGHWGTTPGLNFIYAHLNRVIRERDLDAIYVTGPGHGGPGARRERLPRGHLQRGLPGHHARRGRACAQLFRQFSFPGGIPSHVAPETPGLDPRGRRARLRARARLRRRVRQPGPARRLRGRRRRGRDRPARRELALEQVPQPGARRRRAADPAPQRLQDRQPDRARAHPATTSCARCSRATATRRCFVEGDEPEAMHQAHGRRARRGRSTRSPRSSARARDGERDRAPALADDRAAHAEGLDRARGGRRRAGRGHVARRTRCRSPSVARRTRSTCAELEEWLRSYRPEELFDERRRARGRSCAALAARRASGAWAPTRTPTAALLLRDLACPTSATTRSTCRAGRDVERGDARARRLPARRDRAQPATTSASSGPTRPRPTGSTPSSRSPTGPWKAEIVPTATSTSRRDGRVMEVLSEHLCQGWLEGYLLTGRHGLFNCYEAFIHIVDSMFNQHAKWLKVDARHPVAAADRLAELPAVSSHVWRQDHNGFSHQDPGLHRPRGQQEGRDHPRLPAAGRQLPALGRRPLPAQPRTTST